MFKVISGIAHKSVPIDNKLLIVDGSIGIISIDFLVKNNKDLPFAKILYDEENRLLGLKMLDCKDSETVTVIKQSSLKYKFSIVSLAKRLGFAHRRSKIAFDFVRFENDMFIFKIPSKKHLLPYANSSKKFMNSKTMADVVKHAKELMGEENE